MTLYELSRAILSVSPTPIGKIRFARTIYFVHKELIRKNLMQPTDIAYLRAPLGPVPEGFQRLSLDYAEIMLQKSTSLLSYANEEFSLEQDPSETEFLEQYREVLEIINRTLSALAEYTTSELVEASHDPSWQSNYNGARFFLTPADLKNTFPFLKIRFRIKVKHPTPNSINDDIGKLQAKLLRGMLSDIVKESTDLEYPDEMPTESSSKPSNERNEQGSVHDDTLPKPKSLKITLKPILFRFKKATPSVSPSSKPPVSPSQKTKPSKSANHHTHPDSSQPKTKKAKP